MVVGYGMAAILLPRILAGEPSVACVGRFRNRCLSLARAGDERASHPVKTRCTCDRLRNDGASSVFGPFTYVGGASMDAHRDLLDCGELGRHTGAA